MRVKSQRGFGKAFQVNRQKRLLVQQAALTEVPGQVLVQVHGSSCVFAQVRWWDEHGREGRWRTLPLPLA